MATQSSTRSGKLCKEFSAATSSPKDAGRVLYALQIASSNLKQTRTQPNWRHVERVDPVADQVEAGYDAHMKAYLDKMGIHKAESAAPKESKENKIAV
jgi:hypothetical protein